MRLITNDEVAELITTNDAIDAMRAAFCAIGQGAQQARVRTSAGSAMLSTMGAVLPGSGVAGAKIYTTINGRFRFVIILFSTDDGRPLAAIEADTMTAFRTAAATAVATDVLARKDATVLGMIGTGVQARSHIPALCQVRAFKEILVSGIDNQQAFAEEAQRLTGVPARVVDIEDAAQAADVLVTVTRSQIPLFSGALLAPGSFVAAIGASKPSVREIDDIALARASTLVVEWKWQAQQEAGDLVMCKHGTFNWDDVLELGQIVDGSIAYTRKPDDIVIYKGVGVGVEDVALAELVYRKACERSGS
jgi:ornithine cyclodeaminase